jgi:hypothetical protein
MTRRLQPLPFDFDKAHPAAALGLDAVRMAERWNLDTGCTRG